MSNLCRAILAPNFKRLRVDVWQRELFERNGNLAAVRRRPGVKINHGIGSCVC
jgi:hypothetical protein